MNNGANGSTSFCKYPFCKGEIQSRGLCHRHYQTALKLVQGKRTTWDKLLKSKKIAKSKREGRFTGPSSAWFLGR